LLYISILRKIRRRLFMEADKEMIETLEQDFSILNESNKKNIIEMAKFLVLTQNRIVPGFLEEKGPVDMSIGTEKER
jgi:tRNA 2-selenouridine synthase SelU